METQPQELILKQIDSMEYKDILKLCSASSRMNRICRENKDYIYTRLLRRDWGYTSSTSECCKNVYRLLYETFVWNDYTLGPFDIYDAIANLDLTRVQRLLNMGFREGYRNANMSPLEYALSMEHPEIITVLIESMISTPSIKVSISEMTNYIKSKTLSLQDKIRLVDRFKNVVLTSELLTSISEYYYDPKLNSIMEYIKGITPPDLISRLVPIGSSITESIRLRDNRTLNRLLQSHNFTEQDLQSGLSLAIKRSDIPIIQQLQSYGADFNYNTGKPLKWAIDYSNTETVMYMITNGAQINTPDFAILKRILKRGRFDLLEYFLQHGSLDDIPMDLLKRTFLSIIRSERPQLITLLESRGFRNPYSSVV